MEWAKKGLIFRPDGRSDWARHSALQPTPLTLGTGEIRVFVGIRDDAGQSRIGFVDVAADDPSRVLRVSESPVLDLGAPGSFDDHGVVPSAVCRVGDRVHLYYAGYQQHFKVRFTVLGGLAVSDDGGATFRRLRPTPVLERTPDEMLFRVAHTVMPDNGVFRVWYGGGSTWQQGEGKTLPVYDIRYMESVDGVNFPERGDVCVPIAGGDEYRVGRPYVIRHSGGYRMFYSVGTRQDGYRLGYAESTDGRAWVRRDEDIGITVSADGWDSTMMAYPAVVRGAEKTYLFYNGNDYGRTGFGYAELVRW